MSAQDDIDALTEQVAAAATLIGVQIDNIHRSTLGVDPIDTSALALVTDALATVDPNLSQNISTPGDLGVGGSLNVGSADTPGSAIYADLIYCPSGNDMDLDTRLTNIEGTATGVPTLVAQFATKSTVTGTYDNTEDLVMECWFPEQPYRVYKIEAHFRINCTNIGSEWASHWRYIRANGDYPVTSTIANTSIWSEDIIGSPDAANAYATCNTWTTYVTSGTVGNYIRWAVGIYRYNGAGTATVYTSSIDRCEITATDMGSQYSLLDGSDLSVQGQIKAGGAGSTPPPPPTKKTYTSTYQSTWSGSYRQSGPIRTDQGNYEIYQGYADSFNGNNLALVGFAYSTIESNLAGATVNWVKVTFHCNHTWNSTGAYGYWGGHNYTSKPSSYSGSNVNVRQASTGTIKAGSTYTTSLSTSTFGAFLKSGTWKGLCFGTAPSTNHGYYAILNGYGQSARPYLTINYTK